MSHVLDDLELYVLGVLPPATRAEVELHLGECSECRSEAAALTDVIAAIHETLPDREPAPRLRGRILASAAPARAVSPAARRRSRAWLPAAAPAAAAIVP